MSFRRPSLSFIALLCVSVLFVRVGGMHLHLCLDGQEEPTEVHWADSGVHNDADHATTSHEDRDVDMGEGLSKTAKSIADLSLVFLAAILLTSFASSGRWIPVPLRRVPISRPARSFRPPLRGPPLAASLIS